MHHESADFNPLLTKYLSGAHLLSSEYDNLVDSLYMIVYLYDT